MAVEKEYPGHKELTGGGETVLHSHPGGGANIKSGIVSGASGSVTFNTPFVSTPRVVMTIQDTIQLRDCLYKVTAINTTGFSWEADVSSTLAWVATDAGDP